jgi:hypothetical protein
MQPFRRNFIVSNLPTQFAAHAVAAQARPQIQATARAANPTLQPAAYFQLSFIKIISNQL